MKINSPPPKKKKEAAEETAAGRNIFQEGHPRSNVIENVAWKGKAWANQEESGFNPSF